VADSKIIVARPRFGGYIISEKPCYKHERWVDSQVKANKKVATVAEFFGNGISCKLLSERANRVASAVQGICGNLQKMPSSDSSDYSKVFQSKRLRYQ